MALEMAQQTVVNAGLKYTIFEVENNEPAGTALSTDPPAGTLLDPGSTVTIYYSSGPPERTSSRTPDDNRAAQAKKEAQDVRKEAKENRGKGKKN